MKEIEQTICFESKEIRLVMQFTDDGDADAIRHEVAEIIRGELLRQMKERGDLHEAGENFAAGQLPSAVGS